MKFFMLLIVMLSFLTADAQRSHGEFATVSGAEQLHNGLRDVTDTILPPSFIPASEGGLGCFTGIYASPDSGYVTGNNQYGDLEKAQFYSLSQLGYADTGALQSVLVSFSYKTQNASPENIDVRIYGVDSTGAMPGNLLATSESLNLSAINTSGYTQFIFNTPVQVGDSFFVSVQLPDSTGDTLVILSTADNCVAHSGWSWEKWSNQTWHSILNSWILNIDLAVFPVVTLPEVSGISQATSNEFSLFPNPANSYFTIAQQGNFERIESMSLFDSQGKLMSEIKPTSNSGSTVNFNCTEFPEGLYTLLIHNAHSYNRVKLLIIH